MKNIYTVLVGLFLGIIIGFIIGGSFISPKGQIINYPTTIIQSGDTIGYGFDSFGKRIPTQNPDSNIITSVQNGDTIVEVGVVKPRKKKNHGCITDANPYLNSLDLIGSSTLDDSYFYNGNKGWVKADSIVIHDGGELKMNFDTADIIQRKIDSIWRNTLSTTDTLDATFPTITLDTAALEKDEWIRPNKLDRQLLNTQFGQSSNLGWAPCGPANWGGCSIHFGHKTLQQLLSDKK